VMMELVWCEMMGCWLLVGCLLLGREFVDLFCENVNILIA